VPSHTHAALSNSVAEAGSAASDMACFSLA
jgi:hypothetical protein